MTEQTRVPMTEKMQRALDLIAQRADEWGYVTDIYVATEETHTSGVDLFVNARTAAALERRGYIECEWDGELVYVAGVLPEGMGETSLLTPSDHQRVPDRSEQ